MAKSKPKTDSDAKSGSVDSNTDPSQMNPAVGDMKGDVGKASSSPQKVLENGVTTTEVVNPTSGNPGAVSPGGMRGLVSGGSALGGSANFGANSRGPTQARRQGNDTGYDRLVERESYQLDDTASTTLKLEIEALPSLFDKEEFKSPLYMEADTRFCIDNAHRDGTAPLTNPFEHPRLAEMSKDVVIFGRGQNVRYANEGGQAIIRYPDQTMTGSGTSAAPTAVDLGDVGNYLIKGIAFGLDSNNNLVDVKFVQEPLQSFEGCPGDLAVREDHRKTKLNVATEKVDNRMRTALYDPSNIDKKLFTPLVDQTPDAIGLMMLTSDVAATDGLFAVLALRSYAQAIGKLKQYRGVYGSGPGGFEQLRDMVDPFHRSALERSNEAPLDINFFRSTDNNDTTSLAAGITACAYVMSMDSPRKYVTMGDFFTQPRGLLMPFKHALANFDACEFYADKTALEFIQKYDTKFAYDGADVPVVGVGNVGLIVPYSMNDLYVYDVVSSTFQSKLSTVEYVANNAIRQRLGSPFWAGIVETFRVEVMPRLKASWLERNAMASVPNGWDAHHYVMIPLDFSNDHISFFQMLAADAFARIPRFIPRLTAVYQKFTQDYGFDPIMDDSIVRITQSDAFKGSTFGGVSAGYSLQKVSDAFRLLFEDPERITIEPGVGKGSVGSRSSGAIIRGHWAYNLAYDVESDDPLEPTDVGRARVRFPVFRKGATKTRSYDLLARLGPKTYFRSRDLPIRMPTPLVESQTDCEIALLSDQTIPVAWLSGMPAIILSSHTSNADRNFGASITIGSYLSEPRENGRIAPCPAFMLDYHAHSGVSGVDFEADRLTDIISVAQQPAVLNDDIVTYINRPLESYRLKGVFQDVANANDLVIDNQYGVMLHRHTFELHSGASDPEYRNCLNGFGILVSIDGFDTSNTQIVGLDVDLTLPVASYALDGYLDNLADIEQVDAKVSRHFMEMYPMLYFFPFVTSPFYGHKTREYTFSLNTATSPRQPIPLETGALTRAMTIENGYYEFERMLGLIGLATIDWDEYQYKVASEKEAKVDYILDNAYETRDSILYAGAVSSSAPSGNSTSAGTDSA